MANEESTPPTHRTCKTCDDTKPIAAFEICKNKRGKLYRRHRCRTCKHHPRPPLPAPYTHQRCTTCGNTKPLHAFHPDPTAHGGYRHQCRACRAAARRVNLVKQKEGINAKRRERYAKNPEPHKQAERQRRIEQPLVLQAYDAQKHAKRRGALLQVLCNLTAQDWQDILATHDHRCAYCGRKMRRLTKDHITPVSKGGAHTKSNIVPACQSCNSKKHVGPPLKAIQPLLL